MKRGQDWVLLGAPGGFSIVDAPCDVKHKKSVPMRFDGLVLFVQDQDKLSKNFERAVDNMHAEASIWIAWPKRSSSIESDLDFDFVQRTGLNARLVDNKVCAIDEDWSGLRFVVRKQDRPGWGA